MSGPDPGTRGHDPGPGGPDSSRGKWAVLATVSLGIFMAFLDATVVNMAVPALMQSFSTSVNQASWVLNGYAMVFVVLMISMGRLADQFGRKLLYMIGLTVFTAGSALCGAASSIGLLIGFRLLQAVGAAIMTPVSLALVSQAFPVSERGRAVGVWAAVGAVASAAGPTLGGVLTQYLSWHWVFLVNIPVGLVSLGVSAWLLRESRLTAASAPVDWLGMAPLSAGLLALVWALIKSRDYGWTSPIILGLFAVAAVLVALFVAWEKRAPWPMLRLELFRDRAFQAANLVNLVTGFSVMGALFLLPIFLVRLAGYNELRAAVAITPVPLLVMLTAPFIGRATDLTASGGAGPSPDGAPGATGAPGTAAGADPWVLVLVGFAPMAVGLWLYSRLGADVEFSRTVLPSVAVGLGMGLAAVPATAVATARLRPDDLGVGSGVYAVARLLGAVLGISVLVAVLTTAMDSRLAAELARIRGEIRQERSIPQAVREDVERQLASVTSSRLESGQPLQIPQENQLVSYIAAALALETQAQVGQQIEAEVARLPANLPAAKREAAITAIKERVRSQARAEIQQHAQIGAQRLHSFLLRAERRLKGAVAAAFSLAYQVTLGVEVAGGLALLLVLPRPRA